MSWLINSMNNEIGEIYPLCEIAGILGRSEEDQNTKIETIQHDLQKGDLMIT